MKVRFNTSMAGPGINIAPGDEIEFESIGPGYTDEVLARLLNAGALEIVARQAETASVAGSVETPEKARRRK